jgi:hypothetical protein
MTNVLEYWIVRWSLSSGAHSRGPVADDDGNHPVSACASPVPASTLLSNEQSACRHAENTVCLLGEST